MKSLRSICALLTLALLGWPASASAATQCEALSGGLRVGNAILLQAQAVSAGTFTAPGNQKFEGLPAFCRVIASAAPSPASNIVIEVWLPLAESWNGKALGTGNGGFAGSIRYAALAGGLKRGYAVANTDMGTYPAGQPGISYEAGNGRSEAVKDWGYRATHEMARLTRALTEKMYGKLPRHHIYAGCSTGGHQGLTEAQRFPDDYDAILAGAPGHNRTHLHTMFAQLSLLARIPGGALTPAAMKLWTDGYMKACVGKDGGAPSDNFLTDPTQCSFRPRALLCKAGQAGDGCLQDGQVKVLEGFYAGTRNPRTGGLIYPPEVLGSEGLIAFAFASPDAAKRPIPADLSRWVFGPNWDSSTFDFDRDMAKVDQALGADVNALDPDLSRFVARGGKLILFHGWADAIVSPIDSVLYYDRLTAQGAKREDFARLFMAPGVSHCAGGIGPDLFGQGPEYPAGAGPDDDLLAALDRWVDTGVAPEQVLAKKFEGSSPFGGPPPPGAKLLASRPLCAYPKIARYQGGDASLPTSYACMAAPPAKYERPAPEYLR